MGVQEIIYSSVSITDINDIIIKSLISLVILAIGIFLGRILDYGLRKLSQKLELSRHIRGSFIDLSLVVIRWSIYIIFLNLALNQMGIPALTNFLTTILVTIPAFTGAIIIVAIGASLAYYLRQIIINSEVKNSERFSKTVFYFVVYMFGIYALKTALISFSLDMVNTIILIYSAVFFVATAYKIIKIDRNSE